jgi:alpha-1,3-rhamnosyl/mannosyltransferase
MRIGLSCNFIEPALCQGKPDGIGSFTQGLYQQLKSGGEDIVPVVFPTFKNPQPHCLLPGATVFRQPYSLSAGLSSLLGIETLGATALRSKIDLYHCTDYLIPRLKKIPVIAMIHDAVKVQHPGWNSKGLRPLKTLGLKKVIPWATHYIAPSQAVVPELLEYFGLAEKDITVIHNALSDYWLESVSPAEKQAVLEKYQLRPDFLLFAGTFQPRKNIQRIIDAFKSLPLAIQQEYPLVLVGQQGWIDAAVIQEIKTLSARGKLRWLNYISQNELRCLYQSAKLFLFPSLHEGFGLPILEAFASNTPVITSSLSAMPEVAGNAAYLVDPYQTEAIRQAILTLLDDPQQCAALAQQGKQRALGFTWTQCSEAVQRVYRRLV